MATSLVDYLKNSGKDSSVTSRAQLALDQGLVGSTNEYLTLAGAGKNADINTRLLANLEKSATDVPPTPAPKSVISPPGTQSTISNVSNFNNNVMTGGQVEKATSLPDPSTFIQTGQRQSLSDKVSQIAGSTFGSTKLELDNLRAELGRITSSEKEAAQFKVDQATKGVQEIVGTTAAQDALDANNKKFKVEENIQLYSDIQSKLVAAQEALDMGLIYEKDRPARMKFITGSESTLQKQGLATIGALQGTAAVIKGNIDLARAYGEATVNAINQDNEMSFKALNTLLTMAHDDLVDLTKEERKQIETRLSSIEGEADRLQKNKDDVLDLMISNPKAFQAGGVTLLDSKETALQKMLPTMATDERIKFNADLAAKNRSNTSDGTKMDTAENKKQLLDYKAKGLTYEEAITRFSDVLTPEYIAQIYGRKVVAGSVEESLKDAYYGQFIDQSTGSVKSGYNVTLDSKGNPVVAETKTGGYWSNLWNSITGK